MSKSSISCTTNSTIISTLSKYFKTLVNKKFLSDTSQPNRTNQIYFIFFKIDFKLGIRRERETKQFHSAKSRAVKSDLLIWTHFFLPTPHILAHKIWNSTRVLCKWMQENISRWIYRLSVLPFKIMSDIDRENNDFRLAPTLQHLFMLMALFQYTAWEATVNCRGIALENGVNCCKNNSGKICKWNQCERAVEFMRLLEC